MGTLRTGQLITLRRHEGERDDGQRHRTYNYAVLHAEDRRVLLLRLGKQSKDLFNLVGWTETSEVSRITSLVTHRFPTVNEMHEIIQREGDALLFARGKDGRPLW